jgi:hypothetical protein
MIFLQPSLVFIGIEIAQAMVYSRIREAAIGLKIEDPGGKNVGGER